MENAQNFELKSNTEVKEPTVKPKRRRHTADYKRRILKEADSCKGKSGAIGELLRKEGLYSSTLAEWRKQRDSGELSALSKARGRKSKFSPLEIENQRLKLEKQRLEERCRQADLIIEAQKKISEILGIQQIDGVRP